MIRHELTDQEWEAIRDFFPEERPPRPGRPWVSHRMVVNGILWILVAGTPWRDLPEDFGKWKTVYNRFRRWQQEKLWDHIWEQLLKRCDEKNQIDRELWCVDGSNVRAHRCAAGVVTSDPQEPENHALGRSRGGFGTKLHFVTDGQGTPLAVTATPGQSHESKEFENVMTAVRLRDIEPSELRWPEALAGDKGYSAQTIRDWLKDREIQDVIPTRKDETPNDSFDKQKYRQRNIVERVIGWLKECRRIATRYEKKAVHFLAMVKIAIIRRLLKLELKDRA